MTRFNYLYNKSTPLLGFSLLCLNVCPQGYTYLYLHAAKITTRTFQQSENTFKQVQYLKVLVQFYACPQLIMSSSHACMQVSQNRTVPCHIVIAIHGDQLHVHALQNNDHLVNNGMVHCTTKVSTESYKMKCISQDGLISFI